MNVFAKKAPVFGAISERGWGNGYVCVPEGHPLHGLDYDEIHNRCDVDVNGGITFAESGKSCMSDAWGCPEFVKETDWIIGFDTAHYGDDMDKWPNEESVLAEARRLGQQIEAYKTPVAKLDPLTQELVTRLYNLVNVLDTVLPDKDEEAQGILEAVVFLRNEARETLKKVIQ